MLPAVPSLVVLMLFAFVLWCMLLAGLLTLPAAWTLTVCQAGGDC
jgi:hypothetical protein